MIYKPKYFQLYELLPEAYWLKRTDLHRLWWLFDERVLWTLDRLRELYGKCWVNNWYWGGTNEFGGWRPTDCNVGAEWSQHKFGRAADPKFESVTAQQIRDDIMEAFKNRDWWRGPYRYITCIEHDVPWLHFDCRNWQTTETGGILYVNP